MSDAAPHSINSLNLPVRAKICLESASIFTVDDLLALTERDLLKLPNMGQATVVAVKNRLANLGLALHSPEGKRTTRSNSPSWTYLLLANTGEVYLGATTNLRARLRAHNAQSNSGWTKGRRWHLLGVRQFDTWATAFSYEQKLKRMPHRKIVWKLLCLNRACKLSARHGYLFDPKDWERMHHPSYVRSARRLRNAD